MKKSLVISEEQKYPGSLTTKSPDSGAEAAKPKPRKYAPTITLTGDQVDAFCGCAMKVGDKGEATVHFVVKAASSGDQYGEDLPSDKKKDQKLVLALTHVEREGEGEDDEEDGEDVEEEQDETPEEETAEEKDEPADEKPDRVSPGDAGFDDE